MRVPIIVPGSKAQAKPVRVDDSVQTELFIVNIIKAKDPFSSKLIRRGNVL